jgi:hypothetical protein
MTDTEILAEIERRIAEHIALPGWSEEGAGLCAVERMIAELRERPPAAEPQAGRSIGWPGAILGVDGKFY